MAEGTHEPENELESQGMHLFPKAAATNTTNQVASTIEMHSLSSEAGIGPLGFTGGPSEAPRRLLAPVSTAPGAAVAPCSWACGSITPVFTSIDAQHSPCVSVSTVGEGWSTLTQHDLILICKAPISTSGYSHRVGMNFGEIRFNPVRRGIWSVRSRVMASQRAGPRGSSLI